MPREIADASLRGFFAVELDNSLLEEARRVEGTLRARMASGVAVRWTHDGGRHVTLRFLGSFAAERLSGLIEAAREVLVEAVPFDLRLGSVFAFPPRQVRVVAIDPRPHPPLVSAAAALERAAVRCGFEPEDRPFRPHVTLGRVKQGRLRAGEVEDGSAAGDAAQPVREIVLFHSERHRSGAHYTPLERIALGGTAQHS